MKVFVENLRLETQLGVNADERGHTRSISLDIEATPTLAAGADNSEQLADTLDYNRLVAIATEVASSRHFPLVETLAHTIAETVLQQEDVVTVRVRIRKPGCMPGTDAAGAEITLDRTQRKRRPQPVDELPASTSIAIVGGGPAGIAAALWCRRLGQTAFVLDHQLGGQLSQVYFAMHDIPGTAPITGEALRDRLLEQFVAAEGHWAASAVHTIEPVGDRWLLKLAHGQVIADAVIVATGVRRRLLNVPGEKEFRHKGLLDTASRNIDHLHGADVVVVGGGNAASENALKLAGVGARVTLCVRGTSLSARASFDRAVRENSAISVRLSSTVVAFEGPDRLQAVALEDGTRLPCSAALVRIGWQPNTEWTPAQWRGSNGFLVADAAQQVAPGVFAAGDVRGPRLPAVTTAFGDGASAAEAACAHVGY